MKNFLSFAAMLFYAVFACVVVIFAIANKEPLSISFYPLPYALTMPLFLFAIGVFVLGVLLANLYFFIRIIPKNRELRRQKKRIEALENELATERARLYSAPLLSE